MVTYSPISYAGDKFLPIPSDQDSGCDYAIVRVGTEEIDREWAPGFYRCDISLRELDQVLQTLGR
jgi:hypothetical protein